MSLDELQEKGGSDKENLVINNLQNNGKQNFGEEMVQNDKDTNFSNKIGRTSMSEISQMH